jgi:GNAT superfamily N-acetyltransferase
MAEHERNHGEPDDPACASAVAALEDDPFYSAISDAFALDPARRRSVLARYFAYSIQEGHAMGRCAHLPDPTLGVAVWLLPQPPDIVSRAANEKCAFLEATLDAKGYASYYRIVEFMRGKAASIVAEEAWYLSIIAIHPEAQGQGLGQKLLEPTLAEADGALATCYLETFSPRVRSFYERLGFANMARFTEPTTAAEYAVMVRLPHPTPPH